MSYMCRYLFHPFAIMTCMARSSALFNTVALLAATHFALCHARRRSMAMLALACLLSLYPIALFIPLSMLLLESQPGLRKRTVVAAGWNFTSFLALWAGVSWSLSGIPAPSLTDLWRPVKDFLLYATPLGCNCMVSDLRPNIGLAWYLFVEMFDHFRSFFLAVFQLNVFVFLVPASLKFRSDPLILLALLTSIHSIFKPYPTLPS